MIYKSRRRKPNEHVQVAGSTLIFLTKGFIAIVDNEDYPLVAPYRWYAQPYGKTVYVHAKHYVTPESTQTTVQMHRLILGLSPGDGKEVDHRDRNGRNNSRENITVATHSENTINQSMHSNNTSGVRGVYFHRRFKKWTGQINARGKRYSLGYFEDKTSATIARKAAEVEHHTRRQEAA